MYLQVVSCLDLMLADGKTYNVTILQGYRSAQHPQLSTFRYTWPVMPEPTAVEQEIWFHSVCLAYGIIPSLSLTSSNVCVWENQTRFFL